MDRGTAGEADVLLDVGQGKFHLHGQVIVSDDSDDSRLTGHHRRSVGSSGSTENSKRGKPETRSWSRKQPDGNVACRIPDNYQITSQQPKTTR